MIPSKIFDQMAYGLSIYFNNLLLLLPDILI